MQEHYNMGHAANMEGSLNSEVVIIGGGLSGLTAAALLARARKEVSLFEQSLSEIGGRARTSVFEVGFYFNQGAHALYLSDTGAAVLQELEQNIRWNSEHYRFAVKQGKKYQLPSSRSLVLTTKIPGMTSKIGLKGERGSLSICVYM
jgi:phytoene dehydrogenase-like protein